ncbi:MAG: DNA translocase FtsK, partial [Clostridia bacterium]|nr:DNA translocase FtsK [Clostridia bacterium]
GKTTVCLGVDVVGVPVFADLEKMPHLLVAGATGMGKSVCINSILVSLLYKARPDEIKLILIDPKKVEFKSYASIPHLLVPVVTEAQKAAGALSWAVNEMERRYDIIERVGVRSIKAYNKTLADHPEREPLPQIVIVIDELHDLMIQAMDAVEDSIARIAAKARAAGIILIIGTQRPSVNVITGVIKANIPSRIAFHVASQIDSRTILDATGAEKLLNNGDMLFLCPGMQMMSPKRVQGAFLDDDEVNRVAEYLRKNSAGVQYNEAVMADMDRESEKYNKDKKQSGDFPTGEASGDVGSEEELLYRAIEVALENGKISTSLLQRKLSVGFGKAARMIDKMEEMGLVSPPNGQKPREILVTMDEYRAMRLKNDE